MPILSPLPPAALLQVSFQSILENVTPVSGVVMVSLLILSLLSWTIIFSKWRELRGSRDSNRRFLRDFRQANGMQNAVPLAKQHASAPMSSVFAFGYNELDRQVRQRGTLINRAALERSLQLAISEEIARLERNLNWLATTATITPFIGLFGTVWGIINSFNGLAQAGSASLRAVAPGIADALIATAMGLAAAIPAAVFYNYFGHLLKEMGARLEDFSLEFLNLTESSYGG